MPQKVSSLTQTGGKQGKLATCFSCHGENGQSQKPDVPSLGGEPAQYLLIQLFMYRERLRVAPAMNDLMKRASDDDLRALSEAITRLPPPNRHLRWEIPSVWRAAAI